MALAAGSKLGPYEILAPIGAGGMGEVYRARDTKLKRDVALKVLPEAFAADPERMTRFQREAEVLASLNHPNIAHIYGVEDSALVMELVEGETLPCPLPVETAVPYARQIADALEYAHERGVVHRDLKPANIKVTPEGVVKLLDFGLAKAIEEPRRADPDSSNSPTLTIGATRVGVILGTAAYMSPEQAAGKGVDRRSDIWSFGAVLYEMLSGKKAFSGDCVSDTLASVLKLEPDFGALPRNTLAPVQMLVRRCLVKDRRQRLQAIGEARIVLEGRTEVAAEAERRSGVLPWAIAAVATIALIAATILLWPRTVERPLVRLDVDLGPDVALYNGNPGGGSSAIISPDGTRLVYLASIGGGPPKLYTRKLDQAKAIELRGTEGALSPTFSPDGQWVAFLAGGRLNKISVEGGAVIPLSDVGNSGGANVRWTADGFLYSQPFDGMKEIPASGGAPASLIELKNPEFYQGQPQALPGGKAVLFATYPAPDPDGAAIDVVTLPDHRRRTVVARGSSPRWVPTGHLLYMNGGTLFAVPFDLAKLETRGTPIPLLDDAVGTGALNEAAQLDISNTGTLVYIRGSSLGYFASTVTIQWLDSTGRMQPLEAEPGIYGQPRLSPDGKRLALSLRKEAAYDIQVYDMQRDAWTKLTFGGSVPTNPVWTPDGQFVIFTSQPEGGLYWTRADGAGQPQPLTGNKTRQIPWSVSADGRRLAFHGPSAETNNNQIWTVTLSEEGEVLKAGSPEPFFNSRVNAVAPAFSPDGRWLAYTSNESGPSEVYVRPFPPPAAGQGGKWVISEKGGGNPIWSPNAPELLYQSGDQEMAVKYSVNGDAFVREKPRVWAAKVGGTAMGLSPDGRRLVVMVRAETPGTPKAEHEVVFLQNFFDELRRRAPLGK